MSDIFSLNVLGLEIGITALTLGVFAAVIILVLFFIGFYLIHSWFIGWRLRTITKKLRKLVGMEDNLSSVEKLFQHPTTLQRLWNEYYKTLHQLKGETFATTPAKAIFSESVLVDTPLKVEFFKHLPGILTGIGIIGTFFTLIIGLEQFKVDLDPSRLQTQLQGLIKGVREAFFVSGIAIFSAILVTLFEKTRIHTLYRHVEDLAMALDSLYKGGVEEAYLSRLVTASEENAFQSRQLKDSLVNELKQMLENLVTRQIEASEQHYQTLTDHLSRENERVAISVSGALRESLEAPMSSISSAVGALGQQRGEQVHTLLQDLLTVFMDRLQGTLGQPMQDVSHMVTENAATMTMIRDQIQSLVEQLSSAGQFAQEQMARTLMETMTQAQQRQSEINQGIAVTLDQVRQTLERSQGETQERMAVAVDNFSDRFNRLTDEMQRRQEQNQEIGANGLQSLIDAVHTLAKDIRHSGEEGAETSRNHLLKLLDESETRQQQLSEQVQETLESLHSAFSNRQQEVQDSFRQTTTAIREEQQTAQAQTQTFIQAGVKVLVSNIRELIGSAQQTNQAMTSSIQKMEEAVTRTVGRLTGAGQSAQEQMARTLMETMTQAQQRQSEINQGITLTLDQVRQTLERSQSEVQERMAAAVDNSSEHFSRMTEEMQHRQEQNQEIGAKGVQSLIEAVHTLAQDIRHSGEEGAEASRNHLLKLLDESEIRQQRLSEQVRETLEGLRGALSHGQQEMQNSFRQTTTAIREEQQAAQAQTQTFIQSGMNVLVSNIKELVDSAQQTNQAMISTIQKMEEAVTRTVGRLTDGVNQVEGAAQTFSQTSDGMTRTLQAQKDFQTRVERLATSVEQAAAKLEIATTDQRAVQGQMIELAKQLSQIVDGQKTQTALSQEVVIRMEGVTTHFKAAADEADKFTNGVGQALGESFRQFHTHLQTTLDKQLGELDDKLASTLGHLDAHMGRFGEQVEGFSDLLDSLERQANRK